MVTLQIEKVDSAKILASNLQKSFSFLCRVENVYLELRSVKVSNLKKKVRKVCISITLTVQAPHKLTSLPFTKM